MGAVADPKVIWDSRELVPRILAYSAVRGGVKPGVGQPITLFYVLGLTSLEAENHPALAVKAVRGRTRTGNGDGRSVVRIPEADHQTHDERTSLLCLRGAPSIIRIQASLTGRSSSGISYRSRLAVKTTIVAVSGRKHKLGSGAEWATLPSRKSRSAGFRVWVPTAISLERYCSEVRDPGAGVGTEVVGVAVGAKGRRAAGNRASATRRALVALFTRAVCRVSLAQEVDPWDREAEPTAYSEAVEEALESLAALSVALTAKSETENAACYDQSSGHFVSRNRFAYEVGTRWYSRVL